MGVNVGDKKAQHATVRLGETAGGKDGLAYVDDAGAVSEFKGAIGIGATNAVGDKSVTTNKGAPITEPRDAVGGTLGADDVAALFERLTFSDGRGDVEGIDGVSLVALTTDAFTIAIDNGRAVDTVTFEVGEGWFAANGFDTGADVGDGQSRFSVIEDGDGVVGTAGLLGDLVGGGAKGQADEEAILMAAVDPSDGRVTLLGLEGDNFAVRVNGAGRTDTLLFATGDTAAAIAALERGVVNAGTGSDEFVIVEAGDTGGVAIGGGALNVTDPAPGSSALDVGGGVNVADAFVLADTAAERPNVTAIDQGGTVRVEFESVNGGRKIIVVDDAPGDLVDGGSSVPPEDFLF